MNRPLSILLFASAVAGCTRRHTPLAQPDAPVPVRVAPVTVERVTRPVIATGTLAPKEEIPLSFKVGGVIDQLRVDEGQTVRRGDTLALLDLSEIDAAVVRARSAADKADRDLTRAKRLYGDSVATLEQAQNAQTGRDVAHAELETATFNRRYAVIVAPASGVVLKRLAEPGQLVPAGVPVFSLGSHARGVVVRAGLADRDVVRVRLGDHAVVRFDALPDHTFAGTVTELAGAADPQTGTYVVEVNVPAATHLASGLVGEVEIRPAASHTVALIPVESLFEADGSHATVFAVTADGQHAEKRSVTIAFLAGDRVAVTGGLDGVRIVVTDGAAYLDDGSSLRIRP